MLQCMKLEEPTFGTPCSPLIFQKIVFLASQTYKNRPFSLYSNFYSRITTFNFFDVSWLLIESFRSEFTANLYSRFAVTRLRFDVQTKFDLDWRWIKEVDSGLFFHQKQKKYQPVKIKEIYGNSAWVIQQQRAVNSYFRTRKFKAAILNQQP